VHNLHKQTEGQGFNNECFELVVVCCRYDDVTKKDASKTDKRKRRRISSLADDVIVTKQSVNDEIQSHSELCQQPHSKKKKRK